MRDNQDTSPDIILARHRAGRNQATLNIELAISSTHTYNTTTGQTPGGGAGNVGGSQLISEITGDGIGGGTCFLGETLFTLADESRIDFAELYAHKEKYSHAKSFDEDGNVVKGEILDVFRHTVFVYLAVTFEDGRSLVVGEHRYFIPSGIYIPIKYLLDKYVVDEAGEPVHVEDMEPVKVPKGIYVYNASIKDYQNYCADGKRVHNVKPRSGDDDLVL